MKEALDLSILSSRASEKAIHVYTEAEQYFHLLHGKRILASGVRLMKPAIDVLRQEGQVIGQHFFDEQGNQDILLFMARKPKKP